MNKLMEGWKRFLNEDLLTEGRLQDAKKKFPDDAVYIDQLSKIDPSGNNKYLMWRAKQLDYHARGMTNLGKESLVDVLTDLIQSFHKNVQRLEKKDINQYKSLDDVETAIKSLGATVKQKRKKKKEEALEGSRIVYESDKYFVVRPETEDASCYYGRNTQWCISATESQNYFDDYTRRGKAFYMVRDNYASDKDENKKLALVYSGADYETPEEVYNALDYSMPVINLQDILGEEHEGILDSIWDDLREYGAGTDFSDEFERITSEYNDRMTYSEIGWEEYDFEDYSVWGGSAIDLKEMFGITEDQVEEADIDIKDMVEGELRGSNVWIEDIDWAGSYDDLAFHLYYSFRTVTTPEQYEESAMEMESYDERIGTDFKQNMMIGLAELGLGKGKAYKQLQQVLGVMDFKNFVVEEPKESYNTGNFDFHTTIEMPLDQIMLYLKDRGIDTDFRDASEIGKAYNQVADSFGLRNKEFRKDFLKDIRSMLERDVRAAAQSQLTLPGVEDVSKSQQGAITKALGDLVFDQLEKKFIISPGAFNVEPREKTDYGTYTPKSKIGFRTAFRFPYDQVQDELVGPFAAFLQKLDDSYDEYRSTFEQSVIDLIMEEVGLQKVTEAIELKRKVMEELKKRGVL